MSLPCRLLGHRFRFCVEESSVVWRCRRGCGAGGRRAYESPVEARFYVRRLKRGEAGPPIALLAALSGTFAGKRRS